MNTQEKTIIGFVVVIVLCIIIGAYSTKEEKKVVSVPVEKKTSLSSEFKENFIEGCMEDGTYSYTLCSCSYNSLENQLGTEGVWDLSINYIKTEEFPEEVLTQVVKDCY